MARHCRVCDDTRRDSIDADLLAGKSVPQVARETGLPQTNIYRHKQVHLGVEKFLSASPITTMESIEALQTRDAELAEIQRIALQRMHTQAFVAAAGLRVKIILEIANLRGEAQPKLSTITHVHLDHAAAERIARSYTQHQELSGRVIDATTQKPQ